MDFIDVTLEQKLEPGKKHSELKKMGYTISLNGIIGIHSDLTKEDVYYIDVADAFLPKGIPFKIGRIEAKLSKSFVKVLNRP